MQQHVHCELFLLVIEKGARLRLVARHVGKARAAARHHSLGDAADESVDRVLVPQLLVHRFRLRRRADLDARDGAPQLHDALLESLDLELLVRLLLQLRQLRLEHIHSGVHLGIALAIRDQQRLLRTDHRARNGAQVVERGVGDAEAELGGEQGGASEGADVLQKGAADVAEARRLDGTGADDAALQVEDEPRQRLRLQISRNDEQRRLLGDDLLEHAEQLRHLRHLRVGDEHTRVGQHRLATLHVGDQQVAHPAALNLHPLGILHRVFELLALLDRR
mmetsp:Transcript_38045/g.89059  ORF Transcript_38045/g.89059 Transcript_38045/m.89059 type:complete len:278 (+) Transcript_38045:663-1496(+)